LKINGQFLDKYFQKYEQITIKPGPAVLVGWIFRALINAQYRDLNSLKRYFYSNRCKITNNLSEFDLPKIEILMVSKKEDFSVLRESLESAFNMSYNPVTKISIILPDVEVETCKEYFKESKLFQEINYIPEKAIVSSEVIDLINKNRPDKFGWILQQVLVASYIMNAKSEFILVVDADTVILRPKIWVDRHSTQLLMPTQELHQPYYNFLRASSDVYINPKNSFMSHHLLIQSKIFCEIFEIFNGSILFALQKAFAFSSSTEQSPFDLKYEIYSQYLLLKYPEKIELTKWGNLSLPRSQLNSFISSDELKNNLTKRYNSVSFHSWNI
jgi:hypothetical protein